ncbi:tail fiber domain-containing protein [bacterium]|nr:tail fiber domain-containing protein [bacterium]
MTQARDLADNKFTGDVEIDTDTLVVDSANNNVGIGTSSPVSFGATANGLTINGTTNSNIIWQEGGSNKAFAYTNGNDFLIGSEQTGGNTIFTAAGSERMRIDSSGNLLVGTTSGGAQFNITATSAQNVSNMRNYDDVGRGIAFLNSSGGGVGSITWTASATTYATSSDYRLKEDWQPMTGAIERVNALNPVNFKWIADGNRVDGFLAHEAQAVVPEAVTKQKDAVDADGNPDYQGIDQSKLVPLLTAALQEAIAKIETLETKVAALENA